MSRLENTVLTRFPQPIARAWSDVIRAPRSERALTYVLEVTARTVVALALSEYVAGERDDAVNASLFGPSGCLTGKVGIGAYQAALKLLGDVLGRRSDRIFPREMTGPKFEGALEAARLCRNGNAHPEDGASGLIALREVTLDLLGSLDWLADVRLLRPGDELMPDEQGVLRGPAVLLMGPCDEGQSQISVRWPERTARGSLYVIPASGECLLRVDPFIVHGRGKSSTRELVFLFRQAEHARRKAETRLILQLNASVEKESITVDDVTSTPRVTVEHWLVRGGGQDLVRKLGTPDSRLSAASAGSEIDLGPYERVRELGRTQISWVLEVRDTRDDRCHALKFLVNENQEWERRLEREIETVRGFSHPNILTGVDREMLPGGRIAMRMPVFPTTLQHQVDVAREEQRPLPVEHIVRWMRQLFGALAEVHRHRDVHRDVKPSNLFLRPRVDDLGYDLVLADFGCIHDPNVKMTATGVQLGTRDYEDPRPSRAPTPARDIYSAGIVLGELCTLLEPGELMHAKARRRFPRRELFDLFRSATAEPDDRPDARALQVRMQALEGEMDEVEDTAPGVMAATIAAEQRALLERVEQAERAAQSERDARVATENARIAAVREASLREEALRSACISATRQLETIELARAGEPGLKPQLDVALAEVDTLRARVRQLERAPTTGAGAERRLAEANISLGTLRARLADLTATMENRERELAATQNALKQVSQERRKAGGRSTLVAIGLAVVIAFFWFKSAGH